MHVHGPNSVGRVVRTDPARIQQPAITEQKKYWALLAEKFDQFQTSRNNMCSRVWKRTQHVRPNNICVLCTELERLELFSYLCPVTHNPLRGTRFNVANLLGLRPRSATQWRVDLNIDQDASALYCSILFATITWRRTVAPFRDFPNVTNRE